MEKKYLIDTNILIYYLNGVLSDERYKNIQEIFRESFYISTVTKIELLGWHKIQNKEIRLINEFLKDACVIFIDYNIQEEAIKIRQLTGIATPDAIIAATALNLDMTLLTSDKRDFSKVEGLSIFDPFI